VVNDNDGNDDGVGYMCTCVWRVRVDRIKQTMIHDEKETEVNEYMVKQT